MSTPTTAILERLDDVRDDVENLYRDLHKHPELSHQETETAARVASALQEAGYEVHEGVGGTGVVGVLRHGEGPTVLLRADMDALPVQERTGLDYASTVSAEVDGQSEPVMHAYGHDVHVAALVGAARLLTDGADHWSGTVIALFQPAEETGDGARGMVEDDLADLLPTPDVAFAQHVLPFAAGQVAVRGGAVLTVADSMRITLHGRGGHGSMPQATVDPVVLAAAIVTRLQTVVAREVTPGESAVLTVGSIQAGSKSNVIPDTATLLLNVRTFSDEVRTQILDAIERIVRGECAAAGCPEDPELELFDHFPLTTNDDDVAARVADVFADQFGDDLVPRPPQSASEDFSDIPTALEIPYTYWFIGGIDPETYAAAEQAGRVAQDIPVNDSATFAPVVQPTLDVGVRALVAATCGWLGSTTDAE